jgi:quaternary ammonium compound-resistance protein SugE
MGIQAWVLAGARNARYQTMDLLEGGLSLDRGPAVVTHQVVGGLFETTADLITSPENQVNPDAIKGTDACASGSYPPRLTGMSWVFLIIAGLFEVVWAIGLKFTAGFTRLGPSVITVAAMIASFVFLAQALKTIPVGTGYAVWTGIGAVGVAIIGMIWLGESREVLHILCIVLIVAARQPMV